MLSGKDAFFDKVKGRLAGSVEYITKPFESDALVRSVEKHIAAHKRGGVNRASTVR
jgi:twitching motility two-component system response regulator PilG